MPPCRAPADPSDLASALAFALRFQGRKRVHNADEIMVEIVARRLVAHLERAGFVVIEEADGAVAFGFQGFLTIDGWSDRFAQGTGVAGRFGEGVNSTLC